MGARDAADFVNAGVGPLKTGIFNVADLASVAGVAAFLLPVGDRRDRQR